MNVELIRAFRKSLRFFSRVLDAELQDKETCYGIGLQRCHILLEINELRSTSLKNLESFMLLDKSTLSKNVDSLVKLDLVQRTESAHDRRYITCSLTDKGKALAEQINMYWDQRYREALSRIPVPQLSTVLDSMGKLAMVLMQSNPHMKQNHDS